MAGIGPPSSTSSNRDFLTPVDTTFRRMYLVSQDVFDDFKRFQDANLPPPDPPPSGPPPPGPSPPGPSPPGSPRDPPSPSSGAANSSPTQPILQPSPLSGSPSTTLPQPQFREEEPQLPVFPCPRRMNNGRRCNSKFDTQENLDMHIETIHNFHPNPLSQAAIRNTAERVDQHLHRSIDNEPRLSARVKTQSHRNIANTTLVQSDSTQCKLCSFKGQSPEDYDNHIANDHANHFSISQNMLSPKINGSSKITPRAISLNKVESYDEQQNQSQDNVVEPMDLPIEPVAGPSGTSTNPRPRRARTREHVEPTRMLPRRNRGNRLESNMKAAYPRRNPNNQNETPQPKRRKVQVQLQNVEEIRDIKSKRNADVQQPTVEDDKEQKKKNVFDLAVGRKKRKTEHTLQPPSQSRSSVPRRRFKKKKRKKFNQRLIDRYKGRRTRKMRSSSVHPAIQRNVAALGLSGY